MIEVKVAAFRHSPEFKFQPSDAVQKHRLSQSAVETTAFKLIPVAAEARGKTSKKTVKKSKLQPSDAVQKHRLSQQKNQEESNRRIK